jgi:hypothetical protein
MQPRNHRINVLPLSRSPLPAVNIDGFFRMISQALALYIKTEGPPENISPILVEEFPRERLTKQDDSFDIITFRVKTSTMAASTNSDIIPKRPSLRESRPSTSKGPDYNENVYGWWETVQPEFTIWSRSNANANNMTEWFHVFLMKYAYFTKYFAGRGIENFVFLERVDQAIDHNEGQEVYKRLLLYEFRLNRLVTTETRVLTNVGVTYGIGNETDQIQLTSNK